MFQILTYSWLGMIFLVFILGLFFLEFPLWLRNSQLKRLTKIAAALIKTRSPERSARETRAMVLRKLTSVKWMAEPMKRFDKAWRGSVSDDREEAFDSIFLQEFLSPSIVLPGTANRHMALVLPGMLVGLGIVGPFLGLVLGLPSIGAAPESFAVDEELRNLVGVITQSLGLAFWTSIAGIGLSLLFLFGDRVSVHLVERKVLELSRIVERIYPCLSAGEIARTQQSATARSLRQSANPRDRCCGCHSRCSRARIH